MNTLTINKLNLKEIIIESIREAILEERKEEIKYVFYSELYENEKNIHKHFWKTLLGISVSKTWTYRNYNFKVYP